MELNQVFRFFETFVGNNVIPLDCPNAWNILTAPGIYLDFHEQRHFLRVLPSVFVVRVLSCSLLHNE